MPDALTHYEVAEAARRRLPRGPLAEALGAEHDAYKVGAQGPDFLFYAGVWPWQRDRSDLAFLAHRRRMDETFRAMLAAAAEAPAAERRVLAAWICGHAAHLCTDAGAHPWILYWSGDITAGAGTAAGAAARRRHGVLEASIDVTLGRLRSTDPGWIRRRRLFDLRPAQLDVVARLWQRVLREVHAVDFSAAEARSALRDTAFVYGSMTDPRSPFSRLLASLLPLIDGDGVIRTQIYPATPHPAAAALLAGRRTWSSPCAPGERRTDTFAEIIAAATAETLACLRAIEPVVFGAAGPGAVLARIGDRDMITGLPCGDPRPPVAFAPGLEQIWDGV